jgi:hypothetical protein
MSAHVVALRSFDSGASGGTKTNRPKGGYARLDADWFRRIEPLLTARERRIYLWLVLECDGWDRAITATLIATKTQINAANVRRDIKALETLGLIRREFLAAPQARDGWRCRIVREYDSVETNLRARDVARRAAAAPNNHRFAGSDRGVRVDTCVPPTRAHVSPEHGPSSSQIEANSIPPSASLPISAVDGAMDQIVSDEVVERARRRWPNEHPKIVKPRLERLARTVIPAATSEELALYLKAAAKDRTLQTVGTRRPFLVAATEERFRPWLEKWRRAQRFLVRASELDNQERTPHIGIQRTVTLNAAPIRSMPAFLLGRVP